MTRRWGAREKRNKQAGRRRMVCDVGRVLVIEGSLIRFIDV